MTFSRKVFIALFLSIAVVGTAITWATYNYVSEQTRDAFVARYTVFSKVLGDTLTRLDKSTESLMLNAAQVVNSYDAEKGLLTNDQLRAIRDEVNVTHIFIINKNGKFIRSTNEDVSLIPNAYSFCPTYKNMIVGGVTSDATPIIKPRPEPKPYKFLFIPNRTRERLLEVGVRVDFVAKTLTEALGSDSNVSSMSVYDPSGTTFGSFTSKEYNFTEGTIKLPTTLPSYVEQKDNFKFYTKVASSHPSCCQCDVSGTSKNGEYYYVLESVISKKELSAVLAKTKLMFILFALSIVVVSIIVAYVLVRRLVKNLEAAAERVKQISASESSRKRIELDGNDEVAYLTNQFDLLLDNLEQTQLRALEAEKIQTKIELASEVAHNIKSPIHAIEMMIPLMISLPERMRSVLKNSVREIKSLSESLKSHADSLAGQIVQENELVYLPILLNDFINQKNIEFSERKDISIEFTSHCVDKEAFVKLSSIELKSILSNIVNNAVDSYGSAGGRVVMGFETSINNCIIEISDFGAGIPSEYLGDLGSKRITFKGNSSRGVGLVHAFKVVESWGGKVTVQSKLGSGTSVKLTLPKYKERDSQLGPLFRENINRISF